MAAVALRFIGIGAPKCATTWTYHVLRSHPLIRFPAGKEVNFWGNPRHRGLDWYRTAMADDDPGLAMGEISVGYVMLPLARVRELRANYPEVRLFLHVRNPVDRAWSLAKMRIRDAGRDLDALTVADLSDHLFGERNIEHGDYAAILDRWLSVFPAEQMLVSRFEDITGDPSAAFERLCGHLQVGAAPEVIDESLEPRRKKRAERPLPDGLREMLNKLYAEPMRRFRDIYGIDYT